MSDATNIFHFDTDKPSFEDLGQENGFRFWYATELMKLLGYESPNLNAVNKAMAACAALHIPIEENFTPLSRAVDGKQIRDFKLSRFACYLTTMNGDSKKPEVARAQTYFARLAEAFSQYALEVESVERVTVRDEISGREKALSGTAKRAGVVQYGFFQNAGYRGMYNMNINDLRMIKNVPSNKSPLDYMGSTELAANLFRITQTEEKIKREGLNGQQTLENAAEHVGREVRNSMVRISGILPEQLPPADNIADVKKGLKTTYRGLKQIGASKKKKTK